MRRLMILLICFVFSQGFSECDILYVSKEIPYYTKQGTLGGNIPKGTYAFPADHKDDQQLMIDGFTGCGCFFVSVPANKQDRKKIRVRINSSWTEVYVDTISIQIKKYNPKFISRIRNEFNGTVAIGKFLDYKEAIDQVTYDSFVAPAISNSKLYDSSKVLVWQSIISTIAENQFQIDVIDKESGFVSTRPAKDPLSISMKCKTDYSTENLVRFNVIVTEKSGKTKVVINTTFTAVKDNKEMINCFSNGLLEAMLFTGIDRGLKEQ